MDADMTLQSYGNAVEGALCAYDWETGKRLKDRDAIRIIERLIDIYHYGDHPSDADGEVIRNGVQYLDKVIRNDLHDVSDAVIVKILGVIRFVAERRTKLRREYLSVIHEYVGMRIGTGVRVLEW